MAQLEERQDVASLATDRLLSVSEHDPIHRLAPGEREQQRFHGGNRCLRSSLKASRE
jgi:hypothetical protein